MARIFPTVRRTVVQAIAAAAGVNFPHQQQFGVDTRTRLEAIIGQGSVGVGASQGPTTGLVSQRPAFGVQRVTLDLTSSQWCNVATESAGSDWDNVTASQGTPDGATASLREGLVLTQGTLINDFPDFVNKAQLAITKVELTFHYRLAEFVLAGSALQLQYRLGAVGTPTTVHTATGGVIAATNEDYLAAGRTFDITADRTWTWTNLNQLQALYNGTILVDAGLAAVDADATRLRVTAGVTY